MIYNVGKYEIKENDIFLFRDKSLPEWPQFVGDLNTRSDYLNCIPSNIGVVKIISFIEKHYSQLIFSTDIIKGTKRVGITGICDFAFSNEDGILPFPELQKFYEEYGNICNQCRRDFPDSEKTDNFKCWACRNGY